MASRRNQRQERFNARASRYTTVGSVAYDAGYAGGAARNRSGAVSAPQVLPRERVLARPKANVREKGAVSLFSLVGAAAIAIAAVVLLMHYTQLLSVSDEMVALRSEISELETEQARLLAEYEVSVDLQAIEAAVTADGSMVKPQNEQIIYLGTYEPDSVEFYTDEAAKTGLDGVKDSVQEIWRNIVAYFSDSGA